MAHTLGASPLDEWLARCRDLYLTTRNIHTSGGIQTHNPSKVSGRRPTP